MNLDSAATFNVYRTRLFGIAYRMLGSKADAEDVVQDAYLRWHAEDAAKVDSAEAWLKTVVTRLAIDRLRKAKVERANYPGPWLPEPLPAVDANTPETALELEGDVSIAFLALLETLAPEERAIFVLHDVLDDDYADIASMLGKSEASCRQIVHRARERLTSRRQRFLIDEQTRTRMLQRFIEAATSGDRAAIRALFAENATLVSDGGGKGVAATRPLHGAERISWLWYAVAKRAQGKAERRIVRVNGEIALANYFFGHLHSISVVVTDGNLIHEYYTVANPDKLGSFARSVRAPLMADS